jgi:glucoamylase
VPHGKTLRIETLAPAQVRWSADEWKSDAEEVTRDTGLGIYFVDLPSSKLAPDSAVCFTFYWPEAERWEGRNFEVKIAKPPQGNS